MNQFTSIPKENSTYLGDGVYGHFDGVYFWLLTERFNGLHQIALDPQMISSLNQFVIDNVVKASAIKSG